MRPRAGTLACALGVLVAAAGAAGWVQPPPAAPSLNTAAESAAGLPQLRSLVVSWRGEIVLDHHARGVRPNGPANVKSVSKSVISALVGIAIERGLIKSVDEPIVSYFPELRRDDDSRKAAITIEDLLTMRSGLESTSGRNYGAWVSTRNWVRAALAKPMVSEPGTTMEYSTGSSHVLSAILTKAAGMNTWQFAQASLAKPLGVSLARWPRDPQGIYFGGNEMLMTPRQMIAFGELYLNGGRHGSRRIVPAEWVERSCTPRTASRWNPDRRYGYGWWMRDIGGQPTCFAWGYGGQYIFVFRGLDLVVAATSSTTVSEDRHGHRRALFRLIERDVIAPIVSAAAGSRPSGAPSLLPSLHPAGRGR